MRTATRPTEGELLIRCPYVCLGYYNEPEITRAKLDNGWLRTGDIFCRDKDGFFYFRSRVDDMFSCGGENVYPKEVENLLFAHPDVVNAVVAPVPHPVKGFVPAAMVIARAGSAVTAAELKAYCLDRGPAYSHPRFLDIVAALPLNGAGKIDRGMVQAKLTAAYGGKAAPRREEMRFCRGVTQSDMIASCHPTGTVHAPPDLLLSAARPLRCRRMPVHRADTRKVKFV